MTKPVTNDKVLSPQEYTLSLISGKIVDGVPIRIFKNNSTYIWCPKRPPFPSELKADGYTDDAIKEIWNNFEESVLRHQKDPWYHITFHGDDKTFWHALDKCVIIINNQYLVCPYHLIDESILFAHGFTKKLMYVPVSPREAYLPLNAKNLDELIC